MNVVDKMKADAKMVGEIAERGYIKEALRLIGLLEALPTTNAQEKIIIAEGLADAVIQARGEGHAAGVEDCVFILAELVKVSQGDRAAILGIVHQALLDLNARNKASR